MEDTINRSGDKEVDLICKPRPGLKTSSSCRFVDEEEGGREGEKERTRGGG